MTDLPLPLVPTDVDLRDFPFMGIDIARLFNSEFHAIASHEEWRAGMTLWLKSFHEVPASSLPDDDKQLARKAEYGINTKAWLKVRAVALHGWVKCNDGRLYHQVVAEKSLECWIDVLLRRRSSGAGNKKRWNYEFDEAGIDAQIDTTVTLLRALNSDSKAITKAIKRKGDSNPDVIPVGQNHDPGGTADRVPVQSQLNGTEPNRTKNKNPNPDSVASAGKGFLNGNSGGNQSALRFEPTDETHEKLRNVAPGWDRQFLYAQYREFQQGRPAPNVPQAAFLGWAAKFTKGKPPT